MSELTMPSLGAGMEEGLLAKWLRKPGDRVARGEPIAEVETEKGLIEIEVFTSGVIQSIVVEEGTKVPVGALLATIADEAEPAIVIASAPSTGPSAQTTPGARQLAREAGIGLSSVAPSGRHGTITRGDVARAIATPEKAPAPESASMPPARAKISPLARARAAKLGVDPAGLAPSAAGGAVHAADVDRAAALSRAERAPKAADKQAAMRRAIASAMTRSKREIPHYYVASTIDCTAALAWLGAQNEARAVTDRLLPAVLLLEAAARALRDVPELNAHWTGESAPPIEAIHLGVAISLRGGGLIAPAIHDADRKSLDELMASFKDLVARARTGTLKGSELSDPTATVTSLGERGVETVFPIIHPPQVAMIGFGKIAARPWVVNGEIAIRSVVSATLAADHRVSDGHRGALFLAAIEKHLSRERA